MKWLWLLLVPLAHAEHLDDGSYRCDGGWCIDGQDHVLYCTDAGCTGDPDGFATIANPQFGDGSWLEEDDMVLGLSRGDTHRAYPIRIISGAQGWEMVTDDLDGLPVVVTYCPLCGSAIAYNAVLDGQVLTFRNAGAIWMFDLVMYDASGSQWSQISGEALDGPRHGQHLDLVPQRFTTWAAWRDAHPGTMAMERPVDPDGRLLCACPTFQLEPARLVTGIQHKGEAYAFRNHEVQAARVQQIDTPDGGLVAVWDDGVRVFQAGGHRFGAGPDGIMDEAGQAVDLEQLVAVPSRTTFHHRWVLFFPETEYVAPDMEVPTTDTPVPLWVVGLALWVAARSRRG